MKIILFATVVGLVLLAQDPASRHSATRSPLSTQAAFATQEPRAKTDVPAQRNGDDLLMTWLLVAHENEIALARLAVTKAQDAEAKVFAQRMIDDHLRMVQQLQQTRGTRPGEPGAPGAAAQPARQEPAGARPAEASTVEPGAFDLERLLRELGDKFLATQTVALKEKTPAEFDRCYMNEQVDAHMHALAAMDVFRNYASAPLRLALDDALKATQAHLEHAKDLARRVEVAGTAPRK